MTEPRQKGTSIFADELGVELIARDAARTVSDLPNELARRCHRLLGELLDDLELRHGPADEKVVRKYLDLLG